MAPQLWADKPAVILIIRRPGCALCRDDALELSKKRAHVAEYYGISMFCVVHQTDSWEDLSSLYWRDDVYLDPARGFYKALGKGKFATLTIADIANLGTLWRWNKIRKKGIVDTHTGDSRILGGTFVLDKDGVYYSYMERVGKPLPRKAIVDACKNVALHLNTLTESPAASPSDVSSLGSPSHTSPMEDGGSDYFSFSGNSLGKPVSRTPGSIGRGRQASSIKSAGASIRGRSQSSGPRIDTTMPPADTDSIAAYLSSSAFPGISPP
ncbi:MAG: hypothetical protein SGCHY_005195 [Lobulomycetales sp.]